MVALSRIDSVRIASKRKMKSESGHMKWTKDQFLSHLFIYSSSGPARTTIVTWTGTEEKLGKLMLAPARLIPLSHNGMAKEAIDAMNSLRGQLRSEEKRTKNLLILNELLGSPLFMAFTGNFQQVIIE
jgi:hypothetical protein